MLNHRALACLLIAAPLVAGDPAAAQDLVPHRAAYSVFSLENGKTGGAIGTYAFEMRETCDGYTINQRMRLEMPTGRQTVISEQTSQMTESRDGKRFRFEHRSTTGAKVTSQFKGDALIDGDLGEARFSEPEGQTAKLPAGTLFPIAIARVTLERAKAAQGGFEAPFFFGDKVKPPMTANIVIGKVPKRLAELAIPEGAGNLVNGHDRIYYRGGFFEAKDKGGGEPTYEISSVTLDNGVELYGTNEQAEASIEYRLTRIEALPRPECK